jgi:hypothetical protein
MTYLKCKSCGHYNELKSEFLTFCEHCGKKLPNNYADWKTKHPESDFDTFQRVIAVPYHTDPPGPLKGMWINYASWAGKRGVFLTFALIIAMAAVAGGYFGKKVVVDMIFPKVNRSWAYVPWETVHIGRQALQISTPMHLGVNDQPLSADMAPLVEYAKSYRNRGEDGLQVEVNMYSYKPDIATGLDKATASAVADMQKAGGVSDLHYTNKQIVQSGLNGMLVEGSFSYKNAVKLNFCNLLLEQGQHRWDVAIRYRTDDENAPALVHRIIESIQVQ